MVAGQPITLWVSFAVFWVIQMLIIWRGMEAVRKFENWTAPLVTVGFLILLAYVLIKAGGFGPILSQPSKLGWGADFWKVFAPSLMGMIAFWATLSLNMPDFTRFGGSQRKQVRGQILGLPTTMSFIAIVAILTTSGGAVLFGEVIWDPAQLAARFSSPVVVVVALVALVLATISANLAANVVSPSYDFSNAFPKKITFALGGLITGVIGIVIQPWRLLANADIYINGWLELLRRRARRGGRRADQRVLAAGPHPHRVGGSLQRGRPVLVHRRVEHPRAGRDLVGAVLAVGGAHSASGTPFPEDGLIPFLKEFYNYSWVVGLVAASLVYLLLTARSTSRESAPAPRAGARKERQLSEIVRAGLVQQKWTGDKESMIANAVTHIGDRGVAGRAGGVPAGTVLRAVLLPGAGRRLLLLHRADPGRADHAAHVRAGRPARRRARSCRCTSRSSRASTTTPRP